MRYSQRNVSWHMIESDIRLIWGVLIGTEKKEHLKWFLYYLLYDIKMLVSPDKIAQRREKK